MKYAIAITIMIAVGWLVFREVTRGAFGGKTCIVVCGDKI